MASKNRRNVEDIMKRNLRTRDSDKELIIALMELYNVQLSHIQKEKIRDMAPFETYTRIRREVQQEGRYLPSEDVEDVRYELFKERTETYATRRAWG